MFYPPSSLPTHSELSTRPSTCHKNGVLGKAGRRLEGGGGCGGGGGQYVDGDIFSDDLGMDSSRSQSLAVLMLSETLPVAEGL